jgi:hypothetical protein
MAKYKVPKLESSTFKGWAFVVVAGLLLATLALIDRGGADLVPSASDGSTGCVVEVTTEELNVRAGPSQNAELLGALPLGSQVDATTIVTDGFRQLEGARWASNQFLAPVPGTTCN